MENTAAVPVASSDIPKDARTMAMLSHLLSIFFGFIPALIIWLTKRQDHPFIEDQSKEALNFQITVALAWICVAILSAILIGLVLIPVVGIGNLVFSIIAAMKANDGVAYRYPFALRLVK